MPYANPDIIADPDRLRALYDTDLMDSPIDEAFERLTRLASRIVKAPVAVVSLVDDHRQFFKSSVGLPFSWAEARETPLSHSFCQHVVATGESLIISDARTHPLVYDNMAIPDLDVIGYLGMPLSDSAGHGLGSFCVIDGEPRNWTEEEVSILRELAQSVMTEIELKQTLKKQRAAEAALQKTFEKLDANHRQLQRITEFTASTIDYTIDAIQRGAGDGEVLTYLNSAKQGLVKRNYLVSHK